MYEKCLLGMFCLQSQSAAVIASTAYSFPDLHTDPQSAIVMKAKHHRCMQVMAKDPPCASDAPLGPQRKDAAQVAWAGQGSGMLGRPLDRPTSCPPGARSPAARPCSPDVGGHRGNLPRTGSLAGHVGALTLHGKRPSPELVRLLPIPLDALL